MCRVDWNRIYTPNISENPCKSTVYIYGQIYGLGQPYTCVMGVTWISDMCDGCYVDIWDVWCQPWDVWWVLRGYMYRTKYWNGYMYRTKYWNGIYQIITLLSNISVSALVNNPPLLHNSNVIEPHAKKRTKSSTGTKRKVPLTSSTTSTFMWLAIIKITQSAPQNHAINRFVQLNPHN